MFAQISNVQKNRLFELTNDTLEFFKVSISDLENVANDDRLPDWVKDMAENIITVSCEE